MDFRGMGSGVKEEIWKRTNERNKNAQAGRER